MLETSAFTCTTTNIEDKITYKSARCFLVQTWRPAHASRPRVSPTNETVFPGRETQRETQSC